MKMNYEIETPKDFLSVIEEIIPQSDSNSTLVIAIVGDLGAGKTAFVQQLAHYFGITEPVTSPTFGIMKSYEIEDSPQFEKLIHIDAYRIEDAGEVGPLRLEEVLRTPAAVVCIEWPERIDNILPEERIVVEITPTDSETRLVQVTR